MKGVTSGPSNRTQRSEVRRRKSRGEYTLLNNMVTNSDGGTVSIFSGNTQTVVWTETRSSTKVLGGMVVNEKVYTINRWF